MEFPQVSADKTHHVFNGTPIYAARFSAVGPFVFPGVAAVRDASGAYHIDFSGNPLYAARYAWTDEFSGGLALVRRSDKMYGYIDECGETAIECRFVWAGRFNDGAACVYSAESGAAHLTTAGELLYNTWYLDVRPFKEGKARVRDETGWWYIDRTGTVLAPAPEPADSYPRGTVREVPPENKIAEIVNAASYDACVVLIRHAEREPFMRGEPGSEKPLTARGHAAAKALGASLPAAAAVYASPMKRCMDTAQDIAPGLTVTPSTQLGDPGAYIYDNAASHEFYMNTELVPAIRGYIRGCPLPGHYTAADGTARLLEFLKSVAVFGRVVVCVTHDAFVVSFIAALTGCRFEHDWISFLDGCVLFCTKGRWRLVWRCGEVML